MPATPPPTSATHDVVILGGSLAGAATALLLLREQPQLRVAIIEKSTAFTRRVGEATVEVSAYFLGRVLGLTQHLNECHLVKQGMRFWFANDSTQTLAECGELGGRYLVRVPAYQVDRATLDEEALRRAQAAGATLLRPAKVSRVTLAAGGLQTIALDSQPEPVRARWVVDATGFAALLARQEGWHQPNAAHPTAAAWARWRGVKDWDSAELAQKFPDWAAACYGIRNTATNHLMGDGWWAWWIPLKGGDTSIGVVLDQRRVTWPSDGPLGDRLKTFLLQHPVARELLADAAPVAGDVHWRKNLAFQSTTIAGDGFVLVGDAAGFIDPLYSPGMDWIGYTTVRASRLILAQRRGAPLAPLVADHNAVFARSYRRWFEAIYQDKYEYLGEFDLMRLAFTLDLGMYYLWVVTQPFERGLAAFAEPTFSTDRSTPFFRLIRCYNRRFAAIARARRARGCAGRAKLERCLIPGFTLDKAECGGQLLKLLARWGCLELREGWRSWGRQSQTPRSGPLLAGGERTQRK